MIKTVLRQQENNIYLNRKEGLKSMKKILSAILVAAMLLSTMGMVAFASNNATVASINGQPFETVQAALDAAVDGDVIMLGATTINESVDVKQKDANGAFRSITIQGVEGTVFTGDMEIWGHASMYGAESVTIKNITFDASKSVDELWFIHQDTKDAEKRYAHNVIVDNCKFYGSRSAVVQAFHFRQCKNITVTNCYGENLHSFMWSESWDPASVNSFTNCTVVDCGSGIDVGRNAKTTISNTTMDVYSEYGVRAGADGNGSDVTIKNSEINAPTPVLLRKTAGANTTLSISESALISSTGEANIVRDGSDGNYTVSFNAENNYWGGGEAEISGPANYVVESYYVDEEMETLKAATGSTAVALVDGTTYGTLEEAIAALKDGDTLELLQDITFNGKWARQGHIDEENITIDGNGNTIKIVGTVDDHNYNAIFRVDNTTAAAFKDLTLDLSEAEGKYDDGASWLKGISSKAGDLTVTNCHFIGNGKPKSLGVIYGETGVHADLDVVISGCSFKNFVNGVTDNMNQQENKSVVVEDSEFVNASLNISAKESITVTGNSFENGWVKITSWPQDDTYANRTIVVENNELEEDGDAARNDRNYINAKGNITAQDAMGLPVAKIGTMTYLTLDEAIKAAASGDVIDLMGSTITPKETKITKSVTIKNGTFDVTGVTINGDAMFNVGFYGTTGVEVTFDGINFIGTDYQACAGIFYPYDGCTLNIVNSKFDISDTRGVSWGVVYANPTVTAETDPGLTANVGGKINMENVTGTFDNVNRFIWFGNTVIENSKLSFTDLADDKGLFEAANVSLINTEITTTDVENIYTDESAGWLDRKLSLSLINSSIKGDGDILMNNEGSVLAVDATSKVEVENVVGATSGEGTIVSKADAIHVQFEKVDVDTTGADTEREKDIYNIVLVGDDAEKINELASADLTFAFDGTKAVEDGDLSYAITSKEGVTLSQTGKATEKDRFMFNFNGVNGSYEETGYEIVLGRVTINGYGKYTFGMNANATTNAVYATEIKNNIVDGFETAGELIVNDDVDADGPLVGEIKAEITVPVQKLTINVTFPNAVTTANKELYQDMQVKIEGGNVKKTIALGNERTEIEGATVTVGDGFVVKIDLPYNTTYTVTVSGAGYRTATYSVVLTDDKELTFWNNVMDDDKEIEKNNANSKRTTSFLAGDIVKDNKINIYDLSAVVSYFGKIDLANTQGGEDFAKYDLDRDGKIDAKDVAYVLVSWGN